MKITNQKNVYFFNLKKKKKKTHRTTKGQCRGRSDILQ